MQLVDLRGVITIFFDLRQVSERWAGCCRCHMKTVHTLRFFMGLTTQLQGKMFFLVLERPMDLLALHTC